MRDLKKEQRKLQQRYRLHLNRIKNQHKLYDKEMALLFGWNVDQADLVRKLRAGLTEIHTCDIITLSHNLIQEYRDTSLLQELVPEGYIGFTAQGNEVNGCVSDEINNITMYSGQILQEGMKERPDEQFIVKMAEKIANETATIKKEME